MTPELGLIEGYYGGPWTWEERADQARFLKDHGYSFYLYAPKADPYLRRRWREDYPQAEADDLLQGLALDLFGHRLEIILPLQEAHAGGGVRNGYE